MSLRASFWAFREAAAGRMRGFLTILLCLAGIASAQEAGTGSDNGFTVARADQDAYSQPAPALSYRESETFLQGRSHFKRRWVASVAFNGEWGLGPTFIQTRCSECHINNGRGGPPQAPNEQLATMLVRLSLPGANEHGGPLPDPNYGDQFQNRALQGESVDFQYSWEPVPAEAALYLDWEERSVTLPDGEEISLRRPVLRIEKLAFGPMGEGAMTSLRNTPPLIGLGLLEAVPAQREAANPVVRRGGEMFRQAACGGCHVPELKTAETYPAFPKLANRSFRAYTDLLVHDMGDELADGRPDFKAGPRDWRTAPLWGVGLSGTVNGQSALLHDGRARDVTEAILWHGGEATASRDAFSKLPKADREALARFVEAI